MRNREEEPVGLRLPSRSGPCRRPGLPRPEAFLVERLLFAPQVVDRPRQSGRQDAQRLALAALLRLPLLPLPGPLAGSQKQTRRLAESPAQMGVADLLAAGALDLAGRLVPAGHQPGVGEELPGVVEAEDGVDIVQKHQRQDLADA